jgi:hypothetical protein
MDLEVEFVKCIKVLVNSRVSLYSGDNKEMVS